MRASYFSGFVWLIALFSLVNLPAQETPAEPKGVTVSGTVIQSLTQEPVRRAQVTLIQVRESPAQSQPPAGSVGVRIITGPSPSGGAAAPVMKTAVTGPDGAFRFENVAEGTYMITVQREGMLPGRAGPGLSPTRIQVRTGVPVAGLRYALTPQAIISGRVLDDEGEPLQGAQVMAVRRAPAGSALEFTPTGSTAQTDDRGEYRLRALPPGKYFVHASPSPAFRMADTENLGTALVSAYYPNAPSAQEATAITVRAGQEVANVDVRLRRAPVRRVSGRVVKEDGTPAQSFTVMVFQGQSVEPFSSLGTVTPGREPGTFTVIQLTPGRYTLMAHIMDPPDPASMQRIAVADVDVRNDNVEGVEIRFLPRFALRGRVRLEGAGAEQASASLNGIQVFARPQIPLMITERASVKEDGTFEMSLQILGRYRLSVSGVPQQEFYLASIRSSSGNDVTREIDLSSGASESVIITLRTDVARISAKRPPAENEDQCHPYWAVAIPVSQDDLELRPPALRQLDESGQAALGPLAPGEYFVYGACTADLNILWDPEWIAALPQQAEKIRVAPGEQKTVTLKDVTLPEL